ncbi:GNAT family N-acetyltransferase [Halobacteriales archaeon SW_5_68_122]|nr:MAG: GNAT family N-acetyltransferase [Halobacteriales archaeon SW_5_68_122]
MSVTVDTRLIDTGDNAFVDKAWELKERIRREDDVLKQRHGFFTDAYRRSKVYRLVAAVADDHGSVTCHARASNDDALAFYEHLGFEVERRVENYYEDNGDAYYLRLGDGGITDRLSRFMPGG